MLDFVVVFTKGGVVLWNSNESGKNFASFINSLIRGVILEASSDCCLCICIIVIVISDNFL